MPQFVSKSSEELRFEVYVACKDHDIPFKMLNYDSVIKGGCNLMLELTTDIVQGVAIDGVCVFTGARTGP